MLSNRQSTEWKFIAILLVILGHVGVVPHGGAIGVSVFLTLSGYGLGKSYHIYQLDNYWKKKALNVYLPYLIWSIFIVITLTIVNEEAITKASIGKVICSVLGSPWNIYDPTMWYISYAMLMYLIFWICYKVCVSTKNRLALLSILCTLVGGITILIFPDSAGAYLYTISFPAGVYWGEFEENGIAKNIKKINKGCAIASSFLVISILNYLSFVNIVLYLIFTSLVGLIAIPLLVVFNISENKVLEFLGKCSYGMYLCEGVILIYTWNYVGKENGLANIICLISSIIVGIFLHILWIGIKKS